MYKKILFVLFTIAISLLVSELLFYGQLLKIQSKNNSNKSVVTNCFPTPQVPTLSSNMTPALHPRVLEMLSSYRQDSFSKMSIRVEWDAIVRSIDTKERKLGVKNIVYAIQTQSDDLSNKTQWRYMPDFLYKKTKVIIVTKGAEKVGSYKDITIGDKIKIIEVFDPSISPNEPTQVLESIIKIVR